MANVDVYLLSVGYVQSRELISRKHVVQNVRGLAILQSKHIENFGDVVLVDPVLYYQLDDVESTQDANAFKQAWLQRLETPLPECRVPVATQ